MPTNPQLRRQLLERLGVTPQRLYQLVKERKAQLPMSTEQAIYTLAHDVGLDISKHLTREETGEVRALVAQLKATAPTVAAAKRNGGSPASTKKPQVKRTVVTIAGVKIGNVPGLDGAHA